jgi:hypothetical protein
MSALFQNLQRRFGFGGQASGSAVPRPQVRMCLEALDERILPTFSPGISSGIDNLLSPNDLANIQATLRFDLLTAGAPVPALTGTNPAAQVQAMINLGLGALTVQSEFLNQFTGVFASSPPETSHAAR